MDHSPPHPHQHHPDFIVLDSTEVIRERSFRPVIWVDPSLQIEVNLSTPVTKGRD